MINGTKFVNRYKSHLLWLVLFLVTIFLELRPAQALLSQDILADLYREKRSTLVSNISNSSSNTSTPTRKPRKPVSPFSPPSQFNKAGLVKGVNLRDLSQFITRQQVAHIITYEFAAGGVYEMEVSINYLNVNPKREDLRWLLNRTYAHLVVCNDEEYRALQSAGRDHSRHSYICGEARKHRWNVCRSFPMKPDELVYQSFFHRARMAYQYKLRGYIPVTVVKKNNTVNHFFVLNCILGYCTRNSNIYQCEEVRLRHSDAQMRVDYYFKNGDGGYLSLSEEEILVILRYAMILWAVVLILWIANTVRYYYYFGHYVLLQGFLAVILFFKLLESLINYIRWQELAKGNRVGMGTSVYLVHSVLTILYATIFVYGILLVAKGWQITRPQLSPTERREVTFAVVLYSGAYVLYNNMGNMWNVLSFIALLMITVNYIIVLYMVWFACSYNTSATALQLRLIRSYGIVAESTPVYGQYLLFRRFRFVYAIYMMGTLFGDMVIVGYVKRYPWVHTLNSESLNFFLLVSLCWIFRCKDASMYYQATTQGEMLAQPQEGGFDLRAYRPGEPLPRAPSFMYRGRGAPGAVQPEDEDGEPTESGRPIKVVITPSKSKLVGYESDSADKL